MKLGDGKLPPFIGYLPPVTDGVILELRNLTFKDYPPRRGRTGAQLSESRILALDSLRLHFKQKPHAKALAIVDTALRERKPYGVYLRNFGLGARVYAGRDDPFGLPQTATLANTAFDGDMQRLLAADVSPHAPVVCIKNPAGEVGELPAFIVDDEDWSLVARTLVHNAGLIVMYLFSATAGVVEELELIRSEGKQHATLLVIEEGNPAPKDFAAFMVRPGTRVGEQASVPMPALDDFPHQARHGESTGWAPVQSALREMLNRGLDPPTDKTARLPAEAMPPQEIIQYRRDASPQEFDAAQQLIAKQAYEDAEDALYRAIAFSYWGRDTLGQAVILMTLGRLSLIGFNAKGDAGAYYEMAIDVASEINERSEVAQSVCATAEEELRKLREDALSRKSRSSS